MTFDCGLDVPEPIQKTISRLSDGYEFTSQNNEGGNGYVFICNNKLLNTQCVVKFYNWEGEERYHLEPQALTNFNSDNVLRVLDAGITDDSWAYFLTPLCSEGSLEARLANTTMGNIEAYNLCSDILNGLTYLHGQRYVHRDLKPGNIYLHDGHAVIGDFGSLVPLPEGHTEVKSSRHAVLYRPPESVLNDCYGFQGDLYQVGLILYQLLGGKLPILETDALTPKQLKRYAELSFPDNTIYADDCLKERIAKGTLIDIGTVYGWAPASLIKAIRRATNANPARRFNSAAEFLGYLAAHRPKIPDWSLKDETHIVLRGCPTEYCVALDSLEVTKRKESAVWRNDKTVHGTDLLAIIKEIESRAFR